MAIRTFNNIAVRGIAASVPEGTRTNESLSGDMREIRKTSSTVGIDYRHVADENTCTSDLCFEAATQLLQDLSWDKQSVDAVIFLSQTPDYILPATSCILQHKLGLSTNCIAFDMSLGCSGYIYGLLTAFGLVSKNQVKRVLLLVGDTISKVISPHDMPANVLFGDAGTATAIEYDETASTSTFVLGTDGSGAESLIIEGGGFRKPSSSATRVRKEHAKDHVLRTEEELFMDGSAVFSFTLSRVPESVDKLLTQTQHRISDIDAWLFHQANEFMIDYLANKIGIAPDVLPKNLKSYGNTSPPSIPLLAVTEGHKYHFSTQKKKVAMLGFGVGLSWGSVLLDFDNIVIPELVIHAAGGNK